MSRTAEEMLVTIQAVDAARDELVSILKSKLVGTVGFHFEIVYMPGDGYVILDVETDIVAPIDTAIQHCMTGVHYSKQTHMNYSM